ncbi:CAP domain-containing protein [Anaerospora sp.]|uniref:CAP domain-containing protein n=1 Tax=Anaerospora sp. TaxID=1960278 RepID=UPI00289DC1F6|nr:CAP domain-containing protein [Anaerospora sp.]
MQCTKISKLVLSGLLSFAVLTTSFGGAFATAAHAAEATEAQKEIQQDVKAEDSGKRNSLLVGLAAVAAIAMLSNNHGSSTNEAYKATTNSTSGTVSSSTLAAEEKKALSLMNADRKANGLSELKSNSKLNGVAQTYAQDMINRGFFSHYNPEGKSPFDRMQAAGISYKTAGENLAKNTDVTAAEKAFMASSGHRANILNNTYTDVGIGVRHASDGSVYVVQEFIGQ